MVIFFAKAQKKYSPRVLTAGVPSQIVSILFVCSKCHLIFFPAYLSVSLRSLSFLFFFSLFKHSISAVWGSWAAKALCGEVLRRVRQKCVPAVAHWTGGAREEEEKEEEEGGDRA